VELLGAHVLKLSFATRALHRVVVQFRPLPIE
jgi:hypothetical protein